VKTYRTLAAALCLLAAACSSSNDDSAATDATPPADAAAADPPRDAATREAVTDAGLEAAADAAKAKCNALENVATDVPVVAQPATAPPPEGGALASGTYVLTSAVEYTGPGGMSGATSKSMRMTIRIHANGSDAETVFEGVNRTATLTTSGTTLRAATICPGTSTDENGYTATPTTLTVYIQRTSSVLVYVLSKLP
jgi:hypothetical protein